MKKTMKIILYIILSLIIFACILGFIGAFSIYKKSLTLKVDSKKIRSGSDSKLILLDSNNLPFNENYTTNLKIDIDLIPSNTINAFLSIEDKQFFSHNGINPKRIAGALINNIKAKKIKEGASTITQQLIKNTHLSNEKTIDRKINEIILSIKLEKEFSKKDILECYLNSIYFGNGSKGIAKASQNYFGKSYKDLTLSESALLAGIIKSPLNYSPIYNLENAINRRNLVLSEMKRDGKITELEYNQAKNEEIHLKVKDENFTTNHLYDFAVRKEICNILHIEENELDFLGLKVQTYLDTNLDENLQILLNSKKYNQQNRNGFTHDNGGIVIDNKTGGIKSFSSKNNLNLLELKRQPASAIKPILVYSPALENGLISPETIVEDKPIEIKGYKPHNVGYKNYEYISIRESVEKSLNIPAVNILNEVGVEKAKEMAKNAGIKFHKNDNNLALALGGFTEGTTLIELANSFLPFSNKGYFKKATFIKRIYDEKGNEIYKNPNDKENNEFKLMDINSTCKKVMSEETAYLMTDILKSSTKKGTSSRLKDLPFKIAGKTGTNGIKGTNFNQDAWSIAFTKDTTFGVWIGNISNKKESSLDGNNNGGTNATSIIKDLIINSKYKPIKSFEMPENIVEEKLNAIDLMENRELIRAEKDLPERFIKLALFNKKYINKQVKSNPIRKNMENLEFDCKTQNNKVLINFKAIPFYKYSIIRVEEDNIKTLKRYENKKETIEFMDEDIQKDTVYTYYIKYHLINSNKILLSKKIKIII